MNDLKNASVNVIMNASMNAIMNAIVKATMNAIMDAIMNVIMNVIVNVIMNVTMNAIRCLLDVKTCWRKRENMAFQTARGMSTVLNNNTTGEKIKYYDL